VDGCFEKAREYSSKGLEILAVTLERNHPAVAHMCLRLADAHLAQDPANEEVQSKSILKHPEVESFGHESWSASLMHMVSGGCHRA
jgi:hypothetical protein